ncbi:diadenylate cyclase [Aureliella helgolandensis]|uniref:DisA bacterial checkpoint controller nucleotide-binding protein n=1 Tax=Aureliella helgolandensis TaxID=2527968 RepID=A0A518GD66_9BACT|nr:diadenylate cyclase [Aureliella helgolandensis]QDV26542.1 DisA bacterial checkpoint controller nucleotide-binding protein [Aureliella helgolandensis]
MNAFASRVVEQIRLSDLLDIGIIALLLYVTFVWLRARASRSLGLIAVGLAGVFLLARWLDLYLTSMVFHYGAMGILLALVVVFQHDIRHGFERLTTSRWFPGPSPYPPSQNLSDTLGETIREMAQKQMGALIILPGREPLDRHLHGGVAVDATLSYPLLLSIFHSQSPGHDGAVLIEQGRIARLGIHLPLSADLSRIRSGGTRHAAALGLAECCDATVWVVSEERGTVSIAHDGELSILEPSAIGPRLRDYFGQQDGVQSRRNGNWHKGMVTKLAAVACAFSLWILFAYQADTVQRTFVVPIEYRNLPEGWEIVEPKSIFAEVTLSGSDPKFTLLRPEEMMISLEVGEIRGRSMLRWETQSNLKNLPSELSVEQIAPPAVAVTVRKKLAPKSAVGPASP